MTSTAAPAGAAAAAPAQPTRSVVPLDCVEATIEGLTRIDESGDKQKMNRMARRLGKEQPDLLRFAAGLKEEHGDAVGEAAVFYGTLVWAIFDRHVDRAPRLTRKNLDDARTVTEEARGAVADLDQKPVHDRVAPPLLERQPHILAKLSALLAEDVTSEAMSESTAAIIFPPTQVIVEAFDAAVEGRRPGERVGPIVHDQPKVGRNDPCPCGSGKKYKKCHGA